MNTTTCLGSLRTTSCCSSWVLVLGAWVVVGCGNAALSGKGVSDAHEAPLVHLRAADPDRSASNPAAQSDPTPVDPAHAREVQSDAASPTPNGDVSLATILAFADQHSPVLRVARSTRSRAEAARVAASVTTPSNPELTIAAGPRLANAGTGVELELMLMQQVQIAGERGLRVAASDSLAKLTDAEIEQVRWTVHCEVHAAFHRTLVEQERARLAGAVVGFQEEVLRVVERQIAAGETAPLSLRLAQAEVAQARQVLVAAEQAFTASRIRLAELAGWSVASPPLPTSGVDSPRDPPALERLSQVAREHLPSLRTGAARIEEATSRVTLADRESWPRPALGVQYRREDNRELGGTSNLVMGVLSLPIPSFQLNQGERARARAEVNVARAELDASEQLLDGQIAEARSEVVAAAARTRAYGTEILPRFSENLTLLRRSFELGEIDILALSTGRERFLRIQSDALSAQQDYFVALSGLERVVGVDLWRDDHDEGHAQ